MPFSKEMLQSITGQKTVMMKKSSFDELGVKVPVRDTYCRPNSPFHEGEHCVIVPVRELQEALEAQSKKAPVRPPSGGTDA